jgi:oxygen-independent coproporphyrinogen-3 oxidase
MAGVYIHIPFCRKACHYCNFHFSTSLHRKDELLAALLSEIRSANFPQDITPQRNIETVYFGGGTPSILAISELEQILQALKMKFDIDSQAEITLEANPDDITNAKLEPWKALGINRLSIGVQSFFDDDLQWMNRAHTAAEAMACIRLAKEYGFDNFSIDLIYGTPTLTDEHWLQNIETALALGVNHLSCYALTVEENTALHHFIKKRKIPAVEEEKQSRHFEMLVNQIETAGFEHYEISNFCLPGHRSRHNSNYWSGKPYYGFGPSAHSFDGNLTRWWNIANNALYIENINNSEPIATLEHLTSIQRLNERIMTGLRTVEGIAVSELQKTVCAVPVAENAFKLFSNELKKWTAREMIIEKPGIVTLTEKGKFYADGIAASLFLE